MKSSKAPFYNKRTNSYFFFSLKCYGAVPSFVDSKKEKLPKVIVILPNKIELYVGEFLKFYSSYQVYPSSTNEAFKKKLCGSTIKVVYNYT